ncbi:MAG: FmdB family zinc ribbon protein [Candidatus Dormibacteria bacterium]
MPTYGYHCPHCQTEFEVFQRMTDDAEANCPRCGTAGRRLFFPTGIVFKGSGFYKTDSRRAASASVNGNAPSSAGKAAPDGDKTSTGGTATGSTETPSSGTPASTPGSSTGS